MTWEVIDIPEGMVISIHGAFDDAAVKRIRPQLESISDRCRGEIYVDLGDVAYLDSVGLGAITFLFKRLAARRQHLYLCNPTGQPWRLIELLRVDRVIGLRPLPAAAESPAAKSAA